MFPSVTVTENTCNPMIDYKPMHDGAEFKDLENMHGYQQYNA